LGIALWNIGALHILLREPNAARAVGERIIRYSNEMALRPIIPHGKGVRGAALTQQGEFAEGVAQLREGIAEMRAIGGARLALTSLFAVLADALARWGKTDEGLAVVKEGLSIADAGDRYSLPEIHRVRGGLLLDRSAADRDAAEAAFREAIAIARSQQSRLLELRAATSLTRLLGESGKRDAAREALAPVYRELTEGFDKPDLKDAKTLLDELAW
jgi:predicted ATPase